MVTELAAHVTSRRFGGRTILADVRLEIGSGERVALVGPSGCGKSTLLRILAGLDTPAGASVIAGGQRLTCPDPRRVGVMFQEPRLLPWLNLVDNVALSASRSQRHDPRALSLLADVGLEDRGSALPHQLSGGMAQRVALARALYASPSVLLLDEPFSAVDAITRGRLRALVRDRAAARGASVLLVTHDLDEAIDFADRLLVMQANPGRVVQEHRGVSSLPTADRDALKSRILEALTA